MISLLAIVTNRGDILNFEEYRNDVSIEELNKLICHITKEKAGQFAPFIKQNGISGYYIRRDKLIFIAVSKRNVSSIAALNFLERFHTLLRNFCGSVTEEVIEKNLIIIHELMSECLENGYIQTTNTEQLRSAVYSDPVEITSNESRKPGPFGLEKTVVSGSAAQKPLVKSRSRQNLRENEVFVDVVENLYVRFGKDGSITHFHAKGAILVKNLILQNHTLLICLNEDIELKLNSDDAMCQTLTFLQHLTFLVKLNKGIDVTYSSAPYMDGWDFDETADSTNFVKNRSFVVQPTQGEVSVLRYILHSTIPHQLPFKLQYQLQESRASQDCNLTLKLDCTIPERAKAVNITVHIPVSSATKSIMQQHSITDSSAQFISEEHKIKWFIKNLPGNSSVVCQFKLIDAIQCYANKLEIGPVSIEFEVSNYVCSGISIKSVNILDPLKKNLPIKKKWIRYITLADSYMFKI